MFKDLNVLRSSHSNSQSDPKHPIINPDCQAEAPEPENCSNTGVVRAERVMTEGVTHHVDFFKQDHSVPVRAPPTEAPGMELDESSGHQSSTETSQDTKGQDQSALPVPFTVPLSSLNTCLSFSLCWATT